MKFTKYVKREREQFYKYYVKTCDEICKTKYVLFYLLIAWNEFIICLNYYNLSRFSENMYVYTSKSKPQYYNV